MNRPNPAETERAKRLLALEGATGSAERCAAASGLVFDKINGHLAPLLGAAGVQALIVRSARLIHGEFPFLEVAGVGSSTKLRECLGGQPLPVALAAATALFGAFFTLVTAFIGERLTTQVLRSAWPTIEDALPREKIQ